jgi:hypothetical protein
VESKTRIIDLDLRAYLDRVPYFSRDSHTAAKQRALLCTDRSASLMGRPNCGILITYIKRWHEERGDRPACHDLIMQAELQKGA